MLAFIHKMNEKYVLVEHSSAINTVIHNTFRSTQRIKFTSFDVCSKYIIFGANSGGIYIFSRETCQFIKLIPSTHGSANLLSISEDETDVAVAFSTGVVIILEDCFNANVQQQTFTEHEDNTVTALKWNGKDLFCGDSAGKVSVISLKNFLTKAMFQPPVTCLMHLDSAIVQLDTLSKFLLVSTLTRSLLCDTETERYRQIGKKSRDGRFGACFFNIVAEAAVREGVTPPPHRGPFQTVAEHETLSPTCLDHNLKIYCARPGVRLWQASFQGDVVFTHQFKPLLLNVKQANVVHWDDALDAELKIVKFEDHVRVGDDFNFGKIFPFLNKFIMTFRDDGFYIFEPSSSALLFWRRLENVRDVRIVNCSLYIWHKNLEVGVMSLLSVEELILKSLFRKQYTLCGQLCVEFMEEVQAMIPTSRKIHLVSSLESNLDNNRELLDKLSPIMQRLKECAKAPTLEKLKNGIITINNLASTINQSTIENLPKKKEPRDVLLEQYKINNLKIETCDFTKLMASSSPQQFYQLILDFSEKDQSWCKNIYLKYLETTNNRHLDSDSLKYACEAFQDLNSCAGCDCNFPLPATHKTVPKYYEVGRVLMEQSGETFHRVPYMQRIVLENMSITEEEIRSNIHLLIQYSDEEIIKNFSSKMPYDVWDESVRLLLRLKSGKCLNCGKEIEVDGCLEWTDFGLLMVRSIEGANALKLLKRYANLLPKGALDPLFYQYCIFSSISGVFDVDGDAVKRQLEMSVGGYLRQTYLSRGDYDYNKSSDCDHCQLPLKMPLVEETRMLNCGHNYHQVCFLYNKKHCPGCE